MNGKSKCTCCQAGLSLVELLVAIAIGLVVMSGVVQVLLVSKSNFLLDRELASMQENARYALKFIGDEIRMAGFNGCPGRTLNYANSVNGSAENWYLDGTGIQGYEHEAGRTTFPLEFRSSVAVNSDAIVIRRAERGIGLLISGTHNFNSATMPVNKNHGYKPGQIMVLVPPDCQTVGIFQVSGPANTNNNANTIVHNTGTGNPGNCTRFLGGNFSCNNSSQAVGISYPDGSAVMEMRSQALFVGESTIGEKIPALFRQVLAVNGSTATTVREELVQGIELIQFQYGLDTDNDNVANLYLKANNPALIWKDVVSVRVFVRIRSIHPVYPNDQIYEEFMSIPGTGGSDRYMRQIITTTFKIRN
jgi:type IV pilus assembly protein PilW